MSTELVKTIPDKFEGYYEIKCPGTVKVWGEAAATCRWNYVCYEQCEMHMKVQKNNIALPIPSHFVLRVFYFILVDTNLTYL